MKINLVIDADPIPLQRARAGKNRFYDPQYVAKKNFAYEFMSHVPLDRVINSPMSFDLIFVIKIPKSWSKKKKAKFLDQPHTQTPDVDNLIKFIFDSLNSRVFVDDSQIFKVEAMKMWGEKGKTIMEINYD